MTAIVEKLSHYASEKNFHPYLNITEYIHYTNAEETAEAAIRQLLPAGQQKLVDDLHQNRTCSSSVELEAAFQSGLAIGLELSRL